MIEEKTEAINGLMLLSKKHKLVYLFVWTDWTGWTNFAIEFGIARSILLRYVVNYKKAGQDI